VESRCSIPPCDLDEAWRLFTLLADRTKADFVVGRFALGLAAAGRMQDSAAMLDDYVLHRRRDRGPVAPVFQALVARAHAAYGLPTRHLMHLQGGTHRS
jgi:hypothetical protein